MPGKIFAVILLLASAMLAMAWFTCPASEEQLHSVEGRKIIDMPAPQAWARLQDLTQAHRYVPGIVKTQITTALKTGPGASRRVYQATGKTLNETVVEWDEGRAIALRLHDDDGEAPFPFQHAIFRYQLSEQGNGKTLIRTTLHYQMVGGCFSCVLNRLMQRTFEQRVDQVAVNLKRFYETD